MSELNCNKCEHKLHLEYKDKVIKLKNDQKGGFRNIPTLVCEKCQEGFLPNPVRLVLYKLFFENENIMSSNDAMDQCTIFLEDMPKEVLETVAWVDFDRIKQEFFNEKFIAQKVKFIYDKDDYYFIPGLIRTENIGFLTPIFFNIEVLIKYIYHPQYGMDIGADTFGYIYKDNEHYIKFGINENNRVIMWLGDIVNLSVEEQFYLRSENILSDHSVGSEFYEAEIECTWAEASAEKKLLKSRFDFNEKVRKNFGFAIGMLDTETLRIASNIQKLVINTNDSFKDLMIPLNELMVEAINNKEIKKHLNDTNQELKDKLKDKKGIKLLQLWLEINTENIDINSEIAPLFVLYDLRLVSAHLYSDEKKEEMIAFCCQRLGLVAEERNFITIANKLVEKLEIMYSNFSQALKVLNDKEYIGNEQ